jgi:hypothetical protein
VKLPDHLDRVALYEGLDPTYPYPPTTFLPFREHELGNGDMFGLYWPIGREAEPPLVIEMWHDSWAMAPHSSSFHRFLECSKDIPSNRIVPTPSLAQDANSPMALFAAASESLKGNDVATCVAHLEAATTTLPEYTDALGVLAAQYRRLRNNDAAVSTALQAIRCPPSFGRIDSQLFHWFARQSTADVTTSNDPLWLNRTRLKFQFGGEKHNDDYVVLRDIIDAYIADNRPVAAFTLSQTYAEYMCGETVSFRERYDFDAASWVNWQLEQWYRMTGTSRDIWAIAWQAQTSEKGANQRMHGCGR